MNIFILDRHPINAAEYQCDKHVVKMPLETAQMLCTVLHKHGVEIPYKPTHQNHPCTLWAGLSQQNFLWLCTHGMALCHEYTKRYGKRHKCSAIIVTCMQYAHVLTDTGLTDFVQCVPDDCKSDDAVTAYRNYYATHKLPILTYKTATFPHFIPQQHVPIL